MRRLKRYVGFFLGSLFAVALVVRLVRARADEEGNARSSLGLLKQSAPSTLTDDAVYQVSLYPQYTLQLAEGEGGAETVAFCSQCHSLRYITMQPPLPAATWETEVTKMRKTFGAPIPDASAALVTKYLQTHYTPETRKQ